MSIESSGVVSDGEYRKGVEDLITKYVRLSRLQGPHRAEGHWIEILHKLYFSTVSSMACFILPYQLSTT